jgi:excisionase family DNA binding protein
MVHSMDAELITIKEACEFLGISRRSLYMWMDSGKVKFVRTAGGSRRIIASSLIQEGNTPISFTITVNRKVSM